MELDITIKNFRCFPDSRPARLSFRDGLTAFVGMNSSGKSSLLKFFFDFRSLFELLSSPTDSFLNALRHRRELFNVPSSVFEVNELFCNTNERNLTMEFSFVGEQTPPVEVSGLLDKVVIEVPRGTNQWTAQVFSNGGAAPSNKLDYLSGTSVLRNARVDIVDLAPFFEACRTLSHCLYVGPFRNAINIGMKKDYYDIQIGEAFIKQWQVWKTGIFTKQNEMIYKLTEDIRRIFGFDHLDINPTPDNQTLQIFINGKSYKLPGLGSGLTQFVLVLGNAATKQPSFILIDEPELNLHPSLQLDFLTTLASYSEKGLFFCTHSIGLARSSADHIYSMRRITEGESEITLYEETPRLAEFLGELSFSGYREMGFRKIVLVEGVRDVKVIQQFLRKRKKDHEVLLLPMGGSQLINGSEETGAQLEEIKRISNEISAVIDSERSSSTADVSPERTRFKELCNRFGIRCLITERRAIENYLSDSAVKQVKGDKYRALQPYERLNEVSPTWSKVESWKIAREMRLDDISGTDIGKFLQFL